MMHQLTEAQIEEILWARDRYEDGSVRAWLDKTGRRPAHVAAEAGIGRGLFGHYLSGRKHPSLRPESVRVARVLRRLQALAATRRGVRS